MQFIKYNGKTIKRTLYSTFEMKTQWKEDRQKFKHIMAQVFYVPILKFYFEMLTTCFKNRASVKNDKLEFENETCICTCAERNQSWDYKTYWHVPL